MQIILGSIQGTKHEDFRAGFGINRRHADLIADPVELDIDFASDRIVAPHSLLPICLMARFTSNGHALITEVVAPALYKTEYDQLRKQAIWCLAGGTAVKAITVVDVITEVNDAIGIRPGGDVNQIERDL